jgi:hypothetical protein
MAQITTTLRRLFNELNDAERRLLGQRTELPEPVRHNPSSKAAAPSPRNF